MRTLESLTNQERRILVLVTQGQRNAEIADHLGISTRTVENHLYRLFDKLGVSSRTEAALYAFHSGLETIRASQDNSRKPTYSSV